MRAGLEIKDVSSDLLERSGHFSVIKKADGNAVLGWYAEEGVQIPSGAEVLKVKVSARQSASVRTSLSVDSERTKLEWEPGQATESEIGAVLLQNSPNPFSQETEIGFYLATPGEATVRISDLNGRVLYQHENNYAAGQHSLTVPADKFFHTGVMLYSLETKDEVRVKKMVRVRK